MELINDIILPTTQTSTIQRLVNKTIIEGGARDKTYIRQTTENDLTLVVSRIIL